MIVLDTQMLTWAGDTDDRKSISGYLFQLSGAAVSWSSKKQTCVALPTAKAEYMASSSTAQEAIWIHQLTKNLKMIWQPKSQ